MFPLRDENPTMHPSLATMAIVVANVAAWVLVQGLGTDPRLTESVWRLGVIPGELLGRVAPGTRVPAGREVVAILDGIPNWWSVLTSMFMHGGWMHLIGNMWFLYVFGDNVEDVMGLFRFTAFYLLCGVAAVAAQVASDPGGVVPMVGASGAIGGVMGAYLRLHPMAPVHVLVIFGFYVSRIVLPAFTMLGYWFLIQLISGGLATSRSGGGVAFWAHVGGFAAGFLLVPVFCSRARLTACRMRRGRVSHWVERPPR
jgi:membrane associated rhomboid family serine protease